ncbi:MAG: cysteine--tRNA ligase [Fibrobacterota bacterium]
MDTVYLYNTEDRKKVPFSCSNDAVRLYCCGPTVYNYAHIGNMRTYIFEDILKRVLLAAGYSVRHVVNITDVGHLTSDSDTGDDKMEVGARREGTTVWDIARHYTDRFMTHIADLNIRDADAWPRATDHIDDMIELIQTLESKGYTYVTDDGVYFDTARFPRYAEFAHLDPDQLQGGSRVALGDKKNKTDFALWKFSPRDKKRAMEWSSPWGVGFPGWHIECSVMSIKHLGQPLDIHCGGIDHIQIHHTNEIAQVEAATEQKYCNYWIHGEFMVMDSGKMSKSKGGFITVDTLKEQGIDPLAYRLFCFSAHYRSPLKFSMDTVQESEKTLQRLRRTIQEKCSFSSCDETELSGVMADFYSAIYDDLNMPRALAWLWTLLRNSTVSPEVKGAAVQKSEEVFALDLLKKEEKSVRKNDVVFPAGVFSESEMEELSSLVQERKAARKQRNFETADAIRDTLKNRGIVLSDRPDGSVECNLQE